MSNFKMFDGTNWIDICDCDVHIKTSATWNLLDPWNCVTKYWDGSNWCEVICGIPCVVYSNVVRFDCNTVDYLCSGILADNKLGYNVNNMADLITMLNDALAPPPSDFAVYGTYYDNGDGRVRLELTPAGLSILGCNCEDIRLLIYKI